MIIATEIICLKGQLFGRSTNVLSSSLGSFETYKLPGLVYQQGIQATRVGFPFTCSNGGIFDIIADYSTEYISLVQEGGELPQEIIIQYLDENGYQTTDTFLEGTDFGGSKLISLHLSSKTLSNSSIHIVLNGTQNGVFSAFLAESLVITNKDTIDLEINAKCDPTCTMLPSSTAKIRIKKLIDPAWFERFTEVQIRYRGKKHTFYVDSVDTTQQEYYELQCFDAIGVLGTINFTGCAYNDTIDHYHSSVADNFIDYLTNYAFPIYTEAEVFEITSVNGYIRSGTLREALQQYLFAYQMWVRTDSDAIWVFPKSTDKGRVPDDESMLGGVIKQAEDLGKITLFGHRSTLDSQASIPLRTSWQANDLNNYYDANAKVGENSYGVGQEKRVEEATLVYNYVDLTTSALMKSLKCNLLRGSTYTGEIIFDDYDLGETLVVPLESGHVIGKLSSYKLSFSSFILATITLCFDKKAQSGFVGDVILDMDALFYEVNVDLGMDSNLQFYDEASGENKVISKLETSGGKVYAYSTGSTKYEIYNGTMWTGNGESNLELYAYGWCALPKGFIQFLKDNSDLGIGANDYIE